MDDHAAVESSRRLTSGDLALSFYSSYELHPRPADLVIVDTEVIARAPVRSLVAGMGAAMAVYYGLRASLHIRHGGGPGAGNGAPPSASAPTVAALGIASCLGEKCRDILWWNGPAAVRNCEANAGATHALEKVTLKFRARVAVAGGIYSLVSAHWPHGRACTWFINVYRSGGS